MHKHYHQSKPCRAGLNNPLLAGNMASIFGSGLVIILVSHIFPNKIPFDWELYKTKITTSDDHVRTVSPSILPSIPGLFETRCTDCDGRTLVSHGWPHAVQVKKAGALDASAVEDEAERQSIARIRKPTWIVVGILIFLGFIVWPLLTLPAGDFRYIRWLVVWCCPGAIPKCAKVVAAFNVLQYS